MPAGMNLGSIVEGIRLWLRTRRKGHLAESVLGSLGRDFRLGTEEGGRGIPESGPGSAPRAEICVVGNESESGISALLARGPRRSAPESGIRPRAS